MHEALQRDVFAALSARFVSVDNTGECAEAAVLGKDTGVSGNNAVVSGKDDGGTEWADAATHKDGSCCEVVRR